MPIHRGIENGKSYFQWGKHGAKYFYVRGDQSSREKAKRKAIKQAEAIYAHGYKGK
jgi:hypothetical protein